MTILRVLRAESYTTWQVLQGARWFSSWVRISTATSPSRKPPISAMKSVQLIMRRPFRAARNEVGRERFPHHQAPAQEARLHGRHSQAERRRGLFIRKLLHVAQNQHHAVLERQLHHAIFHQRPHFGLGVQLLGIVGPGAKLAGAQPLFGFRPRVIETLLGLALAKPLEPGVAGDTDEPGGKLRLSLEPVQVLKGLQERVLHRVACLFRVAQDSDQGPVDPRL